VDEERLARLRADLAGDGRSPEESGRHLCAAGIELLGSDGLGIMLFDGTGLGTSFAASDARFARLEDLQFALGEGPGIDAHATGLRVSVPSGDVLAARWAGFAPAALADGVGAVFAIPLRVGGIGLGALDIYRRRPGALTGAEVEDSARLAGIVTQALLALQSGVAASGVPVDWGPRGGFRARVHQAAGMVSEQAGVSVGEALAMLEGRAYAAERPLDDVASDVVERRLRIDDPRG
jgi:hypothetical protein